MLVILLMGIVVYITNIWKKFLSPQQYNKDTSNIFPVVDVFLPTYFCTHTKQKAEFLKSLLSKKRVQLASLLNFTYRFIDNVLSIYNQENEYYLGHMYHVELKSKGTTESNTSASYLDLRLSIERDCKIHRYFVFSYFYYFASSRPLNLWRMKWGLCLTLLRQQGVA